jgi:ketosteroid isomerase-like protein
MEFGAAATRSRRSYAMTDERQTVSATLLKRAIETRDAKTLAALYDEDALLRIIDQENPPSRPRDLRGREAIAAYYDDVCGRAMSHQIDAALASDEALAFTQLCTYPDGAKVFCSAMLSLKDGRIVRQTSVQAWDS